MSLEDLLRDAYQAKAGQLTEARLDQLTAAREHGPDELATTEHTAELPVITLDSAHGHRQRRWLAPGLAAAAVAAVAIGAIVIATDQPAGKPRPNPPATHVSTPPTSAPAPTPSASRTQPQTAGTPPYLPGGQTGSRSQVPWSIVGSGWRLAQSERFTTGQPSADRSVYLYDPAGGRYRITGSLPSGARLMGWSPDGARAMFTTNEQGNTTGYYQLQLRSGSISRLLHTGPANFVSYTRPQGLAFVTEIAHAGTWRFTRYSIDGSIELTYPSVVNGIQLSWPGALYTRTVASWWWRTSRTAARC